MVGSRTDKNVIIFIQSCRQARQLLQDDLTILIGLLTGHKTLNQHLTLLKIKEHPMCPVCEEAYDISLRLPGICNALAGKRRKQLGIHVLVPIELVHIELQCSLENS